MLRPAGRRLATVVAVAVALGALGQLAMPSAAFAWDPNTFGATSEQQLVALHNKARAAAGLKALKVDSALRTIARWRSKDMITRDYFSHNIPPSGRLVFSEMDARGYCYEFAAENIGYNNYPDDIATAAIHKAFMDSPGHRANILGKRWDVMAVGAYKGPDGKKMWTVLFADKCGGTTPTPTPTPKPTPKPTPAPTATPRPTPGPTDRPGPTPTPAPSVDPSLDPTAEPSPSPEPSATATPEPDDDRPGAAGRANGGGPPGGNEGPGRSTDREPVRVIGPPAGGGLVETIVGSVVGAYLGG
jgi:uncharacterized protein YkwD